MSHKVRNKRRFAELCARKALGKCSPEESAELATLQRWRRHAFSKRNWKVVAIDRKARSNFHDACKAFAPNGYFTLNPESADIKDSVRDEIDRVINAPLTVERLRQIYAKLINITGTTPRFDHPFNTHKTNATP